MSDRIRLTARELGGIPGQALSALDQIYRDLSRHQAGPVSGCEQCGACCRFASFGHQLRLTQIELAYLVAQHGLRRPVEPGVCPYLVEDRCAARAGRALGCRVFECRADALETEALYEKGFQAIRALADQHRLVLVYAELCEALQALASE